MKKVNGKFILLMVTVLIATTALWGCGSKENATQSNDADENGAAQKITIFNSKVEISEKLEELAAKYEEETGVEVEVWGSAGGNGAQQLQARLNSGQGPTIFGAKISEAKLYKDYLYDMSNAEYVKHIAPNMAMKVDDKIVGVPYGVEGFGLVYNKDLIKPSDVNDYNSFEETMLKMKEEGISGLDLSQEAFFLIGHILNTPFALQDDPFGFIEKLSNGEVKMAETKEFQEFAKFMDVIRANSRNPLETKYDSQIGNFASGKTAMIHQGNWAYSMFEDYGDLGFEFGMLPFPLEGNQKLAVGVGYNWCINTEAEENEIKAANDFLNWFFTSETGQHYIVDEFGFIPAMTNIKADNLDPLSKTVMEASNSGNTIPWMFNYFPAGAIANDLTPVAQEYFLDANMTGQQLLEKLDTAWANSVHLK